MTRRRLALTASAGLFLILTAAPAVHAQSCESSFTVDGVPMITGLSYKASQVFPKVPQKRALDNVAAAVSAEGFDNVRVDRATSSVSADQEMTGSGRPQRLRVTVRKAGAGSRVDAVFVIQQGQIAPEGATRSALCRVVGSAAD